MDKESQILKKYIDGLDENDPQRPILIKMLVDDEFLPLCNGSPDSYKDYERLNYKEIVYKFSKIHNKA